MEQILQQQVNSWLETIKFPTKTFSSVKEHDIFFEDAFRIESDIGFLIIDGFWHEFEEINLTIKEIIKKFNSLSTHRYDVFFNLVPNYTKNKCTYDLYKSFIIPTYFQEIVVTFAIGELEQTIYEPEIYSAIKEILQIRNGKSILQTEKITSIGNIEFAIGNINANGLSFFFCKKGERVKKISKLMELLEKELEE